MAALGPAARWVAVRGAGAPGTSVEVVPVAQRFFFCAGMEGRARRLLAHLGGQGVSSGGAW